MIFIGGLPSSVGELLALTQDGPAGGGQRRRLAGAVAVGTSGSGGAAGGPLTWEKLFPVGAAVCRGRMKGSAVT